MDLITKVLEQSGSTQSPEQPEEELYEDYLNEYQTVNIAINMPQDGNLKFILVPLAVLLGIITLSALVYLMARKGRSAKHYATMNTNRQGNNYRRLTADEECAEIDDDPTECLLNGKLQINQRYENYQAAQLTIGKAKAELYT